MDVDISFGGNFLIMNSISLLQNVQVFGGHLFSF